MIPQVSKASAPSNDDSMGFDFSTRSARASWAGVGREKMGGHGIDPVILQLENRLRDKIGE